MNSAKDRKKIKRKNRTKKKEIKKIKVSWNEKG
jgi:hypothetical protein